MRVLQVDTERTWRGGERQALLLSGGLIERGHESLFVAPPGAAVLRRCDDSGVPTRALEMRSGRDPAAVIGLARLIRSFKPDVVHTHSAHAHFLSSPARWLSGIGVLVVSRRVDFPISSISARTKYRYGVARIIAISLAIRSILEEAGISPDRISVVHSGIEPAALEAGSRQKGRAALDVDGRVPVVGALCHLARHKGLIHLIRAWPSVVARTPEARLVIVGDGEQAERLHQEAGSLGIMRSVVFTGFRDDVADCLAAFDLFVQPSLTEGLNTTILDALALGRTVLATAVGGIPEVIEHGRTGWLVPPQDSQALAEGIGRLLEDRQLADGLAHAGRQRVLSEFTASRMVEQTEAVYRDVLQRVRSGGR